MSDAGLVVGLIGGAICGYVVCAEVIAWWKGHRKGQA